MKRKLILLSNDDGVESKGLAALRAALKSLGEVYVVAPLSERSAASHSVTLHRPIRAKAYGNKIFAVDGTPADCVLLALRKLLPRKPDLVVSGINLGPNIGDDIHYSGTVSAAREAAILDVPAIAVSAISNQPRMNSPSPPKFSFDLAARFAAKLSRAALKNGIPRGIFLNVNVPFKSKGYEITFLGRRDYGNRVSEKIDPRGEKYYWLAADDPSSLDMEGSDGNVIAKNKISVTPLHIDITDHALLGQLRKWRVKT